MQIADIPGIGEIELVKHARSRSLRITIGGDGRIKITMPKWVPYKAGVAFALTKKDWIETHYKPVAILEPAIPIGKFHHLYFNASSENQTVSTRTKGNQLIVSYPDSLTYRSKTVQAAAKKIAMKALRNQAENLLPKRLSDLADKHDFEFKSVSVRQLKARWGSCNNKKEITLNFFLMQLPWDLIDYVLLHELSHTKALHHGPDFWSLFDSVLPGAKQKRKLLRNYNPSFS